MSVTLIIGFQVKPEKLPAFRQILATVKNELPGTGGCQDIRVLQNADDPNMMTLVETWNSRFDHQSHFDAIVASGDWSHIASHLSADPVSGYFEEI